MKLKRNNITIEKLEQPIGNDNCAVYYKEKFYCYGDWDKAREKFKGCYLIGD
jgi:hypothetical protein